MFGLPAFGGMLEAWIAWPDSRQIVLFGGDRDRLEAEARARLPVTMREEAERP
jgi:hypothetical protein